MARSALAVDLMDTEALWRRIYHQEATIHWMVRQCDPWREVCDAIDVLGVLLIEADARRKSPQLPWDAWAQPTSSAGSQDS